jgi:hypothetical protein
MTANTNKPETPKSFADLVRERPDIFDDMDCRPGPGTWDDDYLLAVVPDHLRDTALRIIEKRKQRAEAAAGAVKSDDNKSGRAAAKESPKKRSRRTCRSARPISSLKDPLP